MVAQTNGSNGTTTAIARVERSTEMARSAPAPELSFNALVKMGSDLVATGFMPDHIRNGAQAAAIIMTGRELGMEPMRALRSLHMVKGKVVEDAASQLSRFKADGGHAKFLHLDETKASLWLRHPNGDEHTETFTITDAKAANLTGDNWRKFPKAMLRSRVITAGLKSLGWEGGVGAYDPDEAVSFAPPAGDTVVERTVTTVDDKEEIRTWQADCVIELDRLGIGANMDKDEKAAARKAVITRLNDGKMPTTREERAAVLADLRAEQVPTSESTRVQDGAGDDGVEDPPR